MSGVLVAHLVRKGNDPGAARTFLESYAAHPAGMPHRLLMIYKGFASPDECAAYEPLLAAIEHDRLFVPDAGFDIGAYRATALERPADHYVFLNSFSRITTPGWLETMYRHARAERVGVVAATASNQSLASDLLDMQRGLRGSARDAVQLARRMARYFGWVRGRFPAFPNPHVRTNAFLIAGDVFRRLSFPRLASKWDAYRFESGLASLTRQIGDGGLRALVVGRDGRGYAASEWGASRTFWSGNQENVLVEDKQTRLYAEGDAELRERLAYAAWRAWPDGTPRPTAPEHFR